MLDLIAYHDPGFHTVIRVWYYVAPAVAVLLFGSLGLSVWRVWLEPRAGERRPGYAACLARLARGRGALARGRRAAPSRPSRERASDPPGSSFPETGLYTGMLIVGAVGSGKTSACMYPFAQQLLSWQADRPGRRASALVLEVKGDFCHKYGIIIANIVPCGPIVFRKLCNYTVIQRILSVFTGSLLC